MLYPVTVKDGLGRIKKILDAKEIKKHHWDQFAKDTQNRVNPGSDHNADRPNPPGAEFFESV